MANKDSLKREFRKRAARVIEKKAAPKFNIEEYCFDKQIAFIKDPAKFKTAVCSRRAGKTVSCAADLLDTALMTDDCNVVYITLSRRTAKRIIWRELMRLNESYALNGVPDKTELTLTLPNKSVVHISGAKDEVEIEKFRGMAIKKCYIDEAQSFRAHIRMLIDDVIVPALWDYDGTLCLIGTPGPVCAGYFFEASHNSEWSNHEWTILDNPHIRIKSGKDPQLILDAERKRRNITEDDPTYQRESLGRWVRDLDSLVFKFDKIRNIYHEEPEGKMEYIFGIDIGFNDADAIAVLGYSYEDQNVYLVEEWLKSEQNISQLVEQISAMRKKYNPVRMVMDAGALGRKIQAEIQTRHGVPLEAAEKTRKLEFIKLLNDDLRTGKLKAFEGSIFEQDCDLVQWDYSNPTRPRISNVFHTDIGDAVLYGWRECKHYFYESPVAQVLPGTDAYMDMLEAEEAEKMERSKSGNEDIVDQDDLEYVFDEYS